MNFYPEQVQAILIYVRKLNEADKEIGELDNDAPYPKRVALTDSNGTDYGDQGDGENGAMEGVSMRFQNHAEGSDTYVVDAICTNCGWHGRLQLDKGEKAPQAFGRTPLECKKCGCRGIERMGLNVTHSGSARD